MSRWIAAALATGSLVFASCFEGLHAPKCQTLADCPVDQGYTSCEDGYCLKTTACNQTAPIPKDGCCPPVEVDRTEDTDCLLLDVDLGAGTVLTSPAADLEGALFLAGVGLDPAGGKSVLLWKVLASGTIKGPVKVGPGSTALPALVSRGTDVYVAFEAGVMRYAAADLSERAVAPSPRPVGGLAATGGTPLSLVAWPAADGKIVLYDETGGRPTQFADLAKVVSDPEIASDTFLAPVVSGSGRRVYVATAGGRLVAVEVGRDPLGPTAYLATGLAFAGPPVEWAGRVFLACGDNKVRAYREREYTFEEAWSAPLSGPPTGPLLVDDSGIVVALQRNGEVVHIRDRGTSAEVAVVARLGEEVAGFSPLLTTRPRILAVSASRGSVLSAWADADGIWHRGLRFDLPSSAVGPPVLSGGRILVPMGSGHLAGWALPEDLPTLGYAASGGDAGQTRKVTATKP